MVRRRKRNYDDPLFHPDHPRPKTRREFLGQGFIMGGAGVLVPSFFGLSQQAHGLSQEVQDVVDACGKQGLDIAVFSDVQPNPKDSNVTAGVTALAAGGHDLRPQRGRDQPQYSRAHPR